MKWLKFWSDEDDELAYKAAFPTTDELFPPVQANSPESAGFEAVEGDWRDDSFWGAYGMSETQDGK